MSLSILRGTLRPLDVAVDLGTGETRTRVAAARDETVRTAPGGSACGVRRGIVLRAALAARTLEPILRAARRLGAVRPRVVATAPSTASPIERSTLADACLRAGASSVVVLPAPLAGAIGSGLDASSRWAQMVVDLGEGLTDVVVLREGRLLSATTVPLGLADLRAEAAYAATSGGEADEAAGRRATEALLTQIASTVERAWRALDDRAASEVLETGILLTGGGALDPAIAAALAARTGIEVVRAEDPLNAAVRGAADYAAELDRLGAAEWPAPDARERTAEHIQGGR